MATIGSRRGAGLLAIGLAVVAAVVAGGTLARAETIRGSVQTADGAPAKGAKVWTAKLWTQLLDRRETEADDQGRFSLEVRPSEWLFWANLGTQGGEISRAVKVQAGQEAEPVAITLTEQGRLRGRLVEAESGKPIAGGMFALDNGLVPIADDQGRFEAVGLGRVGYHEAFVVCPGRARMRVLFVMSDRPETELEIRVPRAGKVVGRVTDVQGRPIPGARVGRSTSGHSISINALFIRCDDQGRFEYDGIALDRPTWLGAGADGYQYQQEDNLLVAPKLGMLTLDFRLARAPEATNSGDDAAKAKGDAQSGSAASAEYRDVSGIVLGPGDEPVAGAAVRWGADRNSGTISTRTGADGRFRLGRVPDQKGVVAVIAAGSKLAPAFAFVQGRGEQDVRVSLVEGRSARGMVRDDRGGPLAKVSVTPVIFSPDPNRGGWVWFSELTAETDSQGRFELSGLPVAGAKFDFLRQGLSDLRNQILELGGPDNTVTMRGGGAIQGRVVDPEGRPVRNFRILLNASRERRPDDKFGGFFAGFTGIGLTYTSDDGYFVVKDLTAGSVQRVTALAPGYGEGIADRAVAEPANLLTPAEALTIRLAPAHALRLRAVEEGSGRPVADARVSLIYDDPSIDTNFSWGYHDVSWGDSVQTRTGEDGLAGFPVLTFSEATLLVRAPGYGRRHLGWRNGAPEFTVALKPEAVISGEVVDKDSGRPLDGVHVGLLSSAGEGISAAINRPDEGRFRLTEIPEGDYTLTVRIDFGGELHRESLRLEAGQTLTRSFRLSKSETKEDTFIRVVPKPKEPAKSLKVGDTAPDFSVKALDDKPLALKDYRGKYVLLDFWATWCGPCIEELRHLRSAYQAFGGDPRLAMISLSLDDSPTEVTQFLKGKDQAWTQAFLGTWSRDPVTKSYGIEAIPAVLLLDPEGKIIARDLRGEAIKKAIADALSTK
jgi:thiol-disulfide isomerase/thioredoxin